MPHKDKEKNKEYQREYQRKWREKNKEKMKLIRKKFESKPERKEYIRKWQKENPKAKEIKKRFKIRHPDAQKEYDKKYRENNPEKVKEKTRKYLNSEKGKLYLKRKAELRKINYQKNKDKINEKRRERNKIPEVKERIRLTQSKWRGENRALANELSNKSKKVYEKRAKVEVFNHYGNVCVCCGEKETTFLTIDHINGGGEKHRAKIGRKIYNWLYRNNFPEGFQTLCFNCNWGKHKNNGLCPHKQK